MSHQHQCACQLLRDTNYQVDLHKYKKLYFLFKRTFTFKWEGNWHTFTFSVKQWHFLCAIFLALKITTSQQAVMLYTNYTNHLNISALSVLNWTYFFQCPLLFLSRCVNMQSSSVLPCWMLYILTRLGRTCCF